MAERTEKLTQIIHNHSLVHPKLIERLLSFPCQKDHSWPENIPCLLPQGIYFMQDKDDLPPDYIMVMQDYKGDYFSLLHYPIHLYTLYITMETHNNTVCIRIKLVKRKGLVIIQSRGEVE